jgi:hypothetical protein
MAKAKKVERCGCEESVALRKQLARAKRLAHKFQAAAPEHLWSMDECDDLTAIVNVLDKKV